MYWLLYSLWMLIINLLLFWLIIKIFDLFEKNLIFFIFFRNIIVLFFFIVNSGIYIWNLENFFFICF